MSGLGVFIMSYKLTIVQKPTYLHAIITGQNTRENALAYVEEGIRECIARNCFRVLVEEHLEGTRLGLLELHSIVSEISFRAFGIIKAIAYVDVYAEGDSMHFAETVAVNRALPIAVFSTVEEAETWLLEEEREGTEELKKEQIS